MQAKEAHGCDGTKQHFPKKLLHLVYMGLIGLVLNKVKLFFAKKVLKVVDRYTEVLPRRNLICHHTHKVSIRGLKALKCCLMARNFFSGKQAVPLEAAESVCFRRTCPLSHSLDSTCVTPSADPWWLHVEMAAYTQLLCGTD